MIKPRPDSFEKGKGGANYILYMSKNRQKRKSKNWNDRQNRDQFVKRARAEGYRGRAVYKLSEINEKYRLIRPQSVIVDLGCAPGSWCQYVSKTIPGSKQILGVDLLPMDPVENVRFIQGDFTSQEILAEIQEYLKDRNLDLVLSDMAPNITGIREIDQARAEQIQQSVIAFCDQNLKSGGHLLTKVFEGEAASYMKKQMAKRFKHVQPIKPLASRSESKELFLLARNYLLPNQTNNGIKEQC